MVQQQISVVTLGVDDLARSKRFYGEGFGWKPVFESDEIAFFQMNGLMLGLWLKSKLTADMKQEADGNFHAFALAHNVSREEDVAPLIARLADHGGAVLREADAPPHGGFRGYVADPDNHVWEIAHNPAWPVDEEGHVTFGT
ncbi:MAG: VOC family protein [Sphingomonas sp.]|uniref:VOC family protein n=1 Tax=Sphingomonas sp. TaxID=28214 RepID=UPI003F806A31